MVLAAAEGHQIHRHRMPWWRIGRSATVLRSVEGLVGGLPNACRLPVEAVPGGTGQRQFMPVRAAYRAAAGAPVDTRAMKGSGAGGAKRGANRSLAVNEERGSAGQGHPRSPV
jgi:hypothetical protein